MSKILISAQTRLKLESSSAQDRGHVRTRRSRTWDCRRRGLLQVPRSHTGLPKDSKYKTLDQLNILTRGATSQAHGRMRTTRDRWAMMPRLTVDQELIPDRYPPRELGGAWHRTAGVRLPRRQRRRSVNLDAHAQSTIGIVWKGLPSQNLQALAYLGRGRSTGGLVHSLVTRPEGGVSVCTRLWITWGSFDQYIDVHVEHPSSCLQRR